MADFFDGSDNNVYDDPPGKVVPWHGLVNAAHKLVSKVKNTGSTNFPHLSLAPSHNEQPYEGGINKPGSPLDRKAKAQGVRSGPTAGTHPNAAPSAWHLPGTGVSGGKSPSAGAPQHPVSHPGTGKPPIKTATGNRGHATTHPPKPLTGAAHPTRHTRPPHAVSKATAGSQHTHSSGPKAGHPAAHKTKIGHAVSKHVHKIKKHHTKKPKKPKKPKS